jgi:hypothetical protein
MLSETREMTRLLTTEQLRRRIEADREYHRVCMEALFLTVKAEVRDAMRAGFCVKWEWPRHDTIWPDGVSLLPAKWADRSVQTELLFDLQRMLALVKDAFHDVEDCDGR